MRADDQRAGTWRHECSGCQRRDCYGGVRWTNCTTGRRHAHGSHGHAPLDCTTTGSSVNCGMAQATSSVDGYLSHMTGQHSMEASGAGFTPYNATNPSGFISGITSSNVTTALGYTPYTQQSIWIYFRQPIHHSRRDLSGSGATSITAAAASGYYMPSTTDQSNWNGRSAALDSLAGQRATSHCGIRKHKHIVHRLRHSEHSIDYRGTRRQRQLQRGNDNGGIDWQPSTATNLSTNGTASQVWDELRARHKWQTPAVP